MSLIFTDTLQVNNSTGLYTLMAYVNNNWIEVHTVTGPTNGDIKIDSIINTIKVNTDTFIADETYQFKWVDSIGNESNVMAITVPHQYAITGYSAALSQIDFVNTGGDSFEITWHITPESLQSLSGATIVSYDYIANHWVNKNSTQLASGTVTTDYTASVTGQGAGVYELQLKYNLSDSSVVYISRVVKTDSNGNIIADIISKGIIINSINELTINATAEIVQSGCNYPVRWGVLDKSNHFEFIGTIGAQVILLMPFNTNLLVAIPVVDIIISEDFGGDIAGAAGVAIYIY